MSNTMGRRPFLRSATGFLALPALNLFAENRPRQTKPPAKRMVFLSFGWGVTEESWYPDITKPGNAYKMPTGLAPLERHRQDFSIVQGLWHKYSLFNDAGHSGSTFWLTGANRFAQPGVSFANTISVDQVAAQEFGKHTRFNSIQINGGGNVNGDGHGPGLSMSWDSKGKPLGGQNHPVQLYRHLFSGSKIPLEQVQQRLSEKRSVLDTMMGNAKQLEKKLGHTDKDKLDEYFESIRKLENRIAKEEAWLNVPRPKAPISEPKVNNGRELVEATYDLMVLAMQTDSTRIMTFRQPVQSLLNSESIAVGGHDISHYHGNSEKMHASQQRDLVQSELLAGFIDRLKKTKEADGSSLFDHLCLVYGSNLRTSHSVDNCPTLVAGGASGIKLGHNHVMKTETPLNNLWLSLLNQLDVVTKKHGDSTGVLEKIMV
ncbi:MAG: DUF1552 domain-containing protein [Akkermansiaceae bacterium]|nr:DUF1552 domain-containing protein [Akkermansiaceae bacterium]